jgi:hypothetical protein
MSHTRIVWSREQVKIKSSVTFQSKSVISALWPGGRVKRRERGQDREEGREGKGGRKNEG